MPFSLAFSPDAAGWSLEEYGRGMDRSALISATGCCDSGRRNCSLKSCAFDGCLSLLPERGLWSMMDCARWTSELNMMQVQAAETHVAHVMYGPRYLQPLCGTGRKQKAHTHRLVLHCKNGKTPVTCAVEIGGMWQHPSGGRRMRLTCMRSRMPWHSRSHKPKPSIHGDRQAPGTSSRVGVVSCCTTMATKMVSGNLI